MTFSYCLQVYYHLGELEQSLKRALAAEEEFDVNVKTLYVTIIIGTAPIFSIHLTLLRAID